MAYVIKDHDLGGILDQSVAVLKDHLGLFMKIMAVTWIPANVVARCMIVSLMPEPPPPMAPPEATEQFFRETILQFQQNLPILAVLWLVIIVLNPVAQVAVIHATSQAYLGKAVTVGESVRMGFSRYFSFFGASLIMGIALVVGLLLCLIPGVIFGLLFCLAVYVAVIERAGPITALTRSWNLVYNNALIAFVLGIILFLLGAAIGMGAAVITNLQVRQVFQVVFQSVALVVSMVVMVVYYYSCRCKLENFDLELMAGNVEGDAQPGSGDFMDDGTGFNDWSTD